MPNGRNGGNDLGSNSGYGNFQRKLMNAGVKKILSLGLPHSPELGGEGGW